MDKIKNIIFVLVFLFSVSLEARVTCKQFNNQSEAQHYYDSKQKGYKLLDRDKDGEACECLSGGSAYSKSVCKRWRKKYNK